MLFINIIIILKYGIVKYVTPIALTTREIEKASNADKELRNLEIVYCRMIS